MQIRYQSPTMHACHPRAPTESYITADVKRVSRRHSQLLSFSHILNGFQVRSLIISRCRMYTHQFCKPTNWSTENFTKQSGCFIVSKHEAFIISYAHVEINTLETEFRYSVLIYVFNPALLRFQFMGDHSFE